MFTPQFHLSVGIIGVIYFAVPVTYGIGTISVGPLTDRLVSLPELASHDSHKMSVLLVSSPDPHPLMRRNGLVNQVDFNRQRLTLRIACVWWGKFENLLHASKSELVQEQFKP